jgi:hypothetical protein
MLVLDDSESDASDMFSLARIGKGWVRKPEK